MIQISCLWFDENSIQWLELNLKCCSSKLVPCFKYTYAFMYAPMSRYEYRQNMFIYNFFLACLQIFVYSDVGIENCCFLFSVCSFKFCTFQLELLRNTPKSQSLCICVFVNMLDCMVSSEYMRPFWCSLFLYSC